MEVNSRVMVQVLLMALVVQVTLSQHWSYGWLPGGKRSVGELEATIRVSVLLKVKVVSLQNQFCRALAFFAFSGFRMNQNENQNELTCNLLKSVFFVHR